MAWTYTGDPSYSMRDEVRFLIQDVEFTSALLQDEEIDYLINSWMPKYNSTLFVAAVAAEVIARKFAGVVPVSADGVNVQTGDLAQRYRELAVRLRAEHAAAMAVSGAADIENLLVNAHFDSSIALLSFSKGMHDNPRGGGQDLGGWYAGWSNEPTP